MVRKTAPTFQGTPRPKNRALRQHPAPRTRLTARRVRHSASGESSPFLSGNGYFRLGALEEVLRGEVESKRAQGFLMVCSLYNLVRAQRHQLQEFQTIFDAKFSDPRGKQKHIDPGQANTQLRRGIRFYTMKDLGGWAHSFTEIGRFLVKIANKLSSEGHTGILEAQRVKLLQIEDILHNHRETIRELDNAYLVTSELPE